MTYAPTVDSDKPAHPHKTKGSHSDLSRRWSHMSGSLFNNVYSYWPRQAIRCLRVDMKSRRLNGNEYFRFKPIYVEWTLLTGLFPIAGCVVSFYYYNDI